MKDYYFHNTTTQEYILFNTVATGIYTILEVLEQNYGWKKTDDIRILAFREGYDVTPVFKNAVCIETEDD
jgi:hypothetical protein